MANKAIGQLQTSKLIRTPADDWVEKLGNLRGGVSYASAPAGARSYSAINLAQGGS